MAQAVEEYEDSVPEITIRVKYSHDSPEVQEYIRKLCEFVRENPPPGFACRVVWELKERDGVHSAPRGCFMVLSDASHQEDEELQEAELPPSPPRQLAPPAVYDHPENQAGQDLLDLENYAHPHGWRRFLLAPKFRGQDHCLHCLCSPCVVELRPDYLRGMCDPHPANHGKRHRLFSLYWHSLNDLGLWDDEEYLRGKAPRMAINDDLRDTVPECVIKEVRRRYPTHDGNYNDYSICRYDGYDAEREV